MTATERLTCLRTSDLILSLYLTVLGLSDLRRDRFGDVRASDIRRELRRREAVL